jgi:nucleotide-binding universal stress UspA family protein
VRPPNPDPEGETTNPAPPILIAYDGSADARRAIADAATILAARDAILASVWERASTVILHSSLGGTPLVPSEDAEAEAEAAKRRASEGVALARAAGFHARGVTAEAVSTIWQAILDLADAEDASLIVVGSRGLTGLRSAVLGSVSHALGVHSRPPLLIVPPVSAAHVLDSNRTRELTPAARRRPEMNGRTHDSRRIA